MAYLSDRADSHRDQDVRRSLAQLAEIADRTGACIVLLRHLRKTRGPAMYAGGGSVGIIGVARAGMVAAVDPDDETQRRRVLARTKGNLAPPWPSLAYQLVTGETRNVVRIKWLGESAHTGDSLLTPGMADEARPEADEATDWLRSVLAEGPMRRADLVPLARREGIRDKALRTARERLGVIVERDSSKEGRPSTWSLPEYVPTSTCPPDRARTPQVDDQGKHPENEGYVPNMSPGHVPPDTTADDRPQTTSEAP